MHVHRLSYATAALVVAFALALPVAALARSLPAMVAAALHAEHVPARNVAVYVQRIGARRPLIAYNAYKPMAPASTMKLVTTFAAFDLLGPTFRWTTQAYTAGPLKNGVLNGDLVLHGTGDPKLTVEAFWLMLRALRARGLRDIRGNLVLDRSYFAPLPQDEGRFDHEPLEPYNVVPDALLLNFKAYSFTFVPDPSDSAVRIAVEPRSTLLTVENEVRLTNGSCPDWLDRLKSDFETAGAMAYARFSGTYASSCGEQTWSVALQSPQDFLYGVFRQLWKELGGSLSGGVRDGTVPPGATLLYTHESPPLSEVVRDMNKFSNNVMARQIFLTLSAHETQRPGRPDRSIRVVRDWLARRRLKIPGLVIENGSGLSRIARVSAVGMGRLLLAAYASPLMPEFIASMPLVAYDGTMKRRLRNRPIAGHAHIKTGSLAGVRALAGYVLDARGRRMVVVFLANHPNAAATRGAQDALLNWVYGRPARSRAHGATPGHAMRAR